MSSQSGAPEGSVILHSPLEELAFRDMWQNQPVNTLTLLLV